MSGELIDLDGLDSSQAFLCLLPYMAHPTDKHRRELFEALLLGKLYAGIQEPLPADSLPSLVEAAAVGVGDDFDAAGPRGSMAGEVLLMILYLDAAGAAPGLDRAQHVVSEWFRQTPSPSGKRFRAGRDTVRSAWRAYRDVAHLWAALSLVRRTEGVHAALDGLRLAAVAGGLAAAAEKVSAPSGEPVLPKSTFSLSVAAVPVHPPSLLSPGVREALDSYQPRNA